MNLKCSVQSILSCQPRASHLFLLRGIGRCSNDLLLVTPRHARANQQDRLCLQRFHMLLVVIWAAQHFLEPSELLPVLVSKGTWGKWGWTKSWEAHCSFNFAVLVRQRYKNGLFYSKLTETDLNFNTLDRKRPSKLQSKGLACQSTLLANHPAFGDDFLLVTMLLPFLGAAHVRACQAHIMMSRDLPTHFRVQLLKKQLGKKLSTVAWETPRAGFFNLCFRNLGGIQWLTYTM